MLSIQLDERGMVASADRLTAAQAAPVLGVSEQTVRVWTRTGRLPAQRTPLGALLDSQAGTASVPLARPRGRASPPPPPSAPLSSRSHRWGYCRRDDSGAQASRRHQAAPPPVAGDVGEAAAQGTDRAGSALRDQAEVAGAEPMGDAVD